MMISKRKFKAFITFNWYIFLIFAFISIFVFYSIFDVKNQTKYEEKICVFIENKNVDKNQLSTDMYTYLDNEITKEVSIDYSDPTSNNYSLVFNTRGVVNTDIIILSSDYLQSSYYSRYFAILDTNYLESIINQEVEYIKDSTNNYGINVTNKIEKYMKVETNYYLFFNKNSTKIGKLNSESINEEAIKAIKALV